MTHAPATPELVERLETFSETYTSPGKIVLGQTLQEAADALEAQQARIAELEVENERLRLTMLGGEDVAGFASSLPLAQVLDSFRTYETALRDSANSAQALADRYEKALRAERDWHELRWDLSLDGAREESACGTKATEQALMRRATQHRERLEAIDQALSSQGRREGGAFDLLKLAEVATKAVYTHGFGFREVVGPSERDGKVYVNFALDDDRLVRAIFFVSPGEGPSPDNTNPKAEAPEHG